jgi:tRNA (guanine-N7-)-methyltransferase
MSRRVLRKIDPALDLRSFLFELESMPEETFSIESFFGRAAPFEIEVGSGKGLFMQTVAERRPDHDFLGIEMARKYARYSAARLARHDLTNGKMICGDGLRFFRERLPVSCAEAVHIYFPDPWWKKRHRKRRVMTPDFVSDIQRVLQPDGVLHFWTDVHEYFESTLEIIADQPGLVGPEVVSEKSADHDLDYRTHFERRMRLNNEPVYRSRFRKSS